MISRKKGFYVAILKLVMTKQKHFIIILNYFFIRNPHHVSFKSTTSVPLLREKKC